MKIKADASPELTDASVRSATKKGLDEWYAYLDKQGGLDKGRRELVNTLYGECKLDEWWSTTLVVEYEKARGAKEKDGKPKGYSICSTKTIAASLDKVFGAFGDAKKLDVWLGKESKVDFKDGGTLVNGDGDAATFTRIRVNKDLRFSWDGKPAPGSALEVLFADKGQGKTGITLNHTRIQERRAADELRSGWASSLDALKTLLESK